MTESRLKDFSELVGSVNPPLPSEKSGMVGYVQLTSGLWEGLTAEGSDWATASLAFCLYPLRW